MSVKIIMVRRLKGFVFLFLECKGSLAVSCAGQFSQVAAFTYLSLVWGWEVESKSQLFWAVSFIISL